MSDKTKIDLNDFVIAINIIDAFTSRGAIKGDELVIVGTLRDKFAAFVKENAPKETEEKQQEETE